MSLLPGSDSSSREEIKTQFYMREGVYRQSSLADVLRPNRNQQTVPQTPQAPGAAATATPNAPVQLSFCTYRSSTSSPVQEREAPKHDVIDASRSDETELICFNYGRELYTYSLPNRHSNHSMDYVCRDKRSYKGTFPTSHDFNRFLASRESNSRVLVVVGFSMGQIQVVDPLEKDPTRMLNKLFNEDRLIEKSRVTCVRWVPNSPNQFLVAHASGQLYLYSEDFHCGPGQPCYQLFKSGEQYSVHICKTKSNRNPIYRWCIGCTHFTTAPSSSLDSFASSPNGTAQKGGVRLFNSTASSRDGTLSVKNGASLKEASIKDTDSNYSANAYTYAGQSLTINGAQACNAAGQYDASLTGSGVIQALQNGTLLAPSTAAVHQFAFSPCYRYLAVVSADGRLRVFDYHEMELIGTMRSYFGALLCCAWSPDSRLVAVGGEDDLIAIWSLIERRVLCRGQGHKSWVTRVAFDSHFTYAQFLNERLADAANNEPADSSDEDVSLGLAAPPNAHNVISRRARERSSRTTSRNSVSVFTELNLSAFAHSNDTNSLVNSNSLALPSGNQSVPKGSSSSVNQSDGQSGRLKRSSTLCSAGTGIGLAASAQPLYYRFGSVGQDTLMCLWELIIDDPAYSASRNPLSQSQHSSRPSSGSLIQASVSGSELPNVTNGKNSLSKKSKDHVALPGNLDGVTLQRFATLSVANDKNSANSASGKSSRGHKRNASNESGSSSQSERDGTSSSKDSAKATDSKSKKDHKRYFSISWGRKDAVQQNGTRPNATGKSQSNGMHQKSASASGTSSLFTKHKHGPSSGSGSSAPQNGLNLSLAIDENNPAPQSQSLSAGASGPLSTSQTQTTQSASAPHSHADTARHSDSTSRRRGSSPSTSGYVSALGTPCCPRLEQVPILEPLTCKRIAHDRLSDIVFRDDCIVTTCHDCLITAWLRPGRSNNTTGSRVASDPASSKAHQHNGELNDAFGRMHNRAGQQVSVGGSSSKSTSGSAAGSSSGSGGNSYVDGTQTTVHTFASPSNAEASFSRSAIARGNLKSTVTPNVGGASSTSTPPFAYAFK